MDVIVAVEPGVEQVVNMDGTFSMQPLPPAGKRKVKFALFDHLGTAKLLVNDQGNVVWPHPDDGPNELLPFGKDVDYNVDNPDPQQAAYKLTFTNKEIDHELDLHYFGARYYMANSCRFLSPDPVGGTPENPISWNRYLYCRNDPVNKFDPDGRDPSITTGPADWKGWGELISISAGFALRMTPYGRLGNFLIAGGIGLYAYDFCSTWLGDENVWVAGKMWEKNILLTQIENSTLTPKDLQKMGYIKSNEALLQIPYVTIQDLMDLGLITYEDALKLVESLNSQCGQNTTQDQDTLNIFEEFADPWNDLQDASGESMFREFEKSTPGG